ncbi:hypothetical protein E2P81_ATG08051 [Venturia nashicola]|nr:hypothetical protein E2P81_ATG08051 [Venturia nashicola]
MRRKPDSIGPSGSDPDPDSDSATTPLEYCSWSLAIRTIWAHAVSDAARRSMVQGIAAEPLLAVTTTLDDEAELVILNSIMPREKQRGSGLPNRPASSGSMGE